MAMRPLLTGAAIAVAVLVVVGLVATFIFVRGTGLSARAEPGAVETAVARWLRAIAVPPDYASLSNPVLANEESVRNGMAHFADHCASCHANDGSGDTSMGNSMFPPAPDMRQPTTQTLSDGSLFYVIEHGIRFTGMPAWGTGTPEGEESSWHLVNFIRHLPGLSEEEIAQMEDMNPRAPSEVRQEIEEQRFLEGGSTPPEPSASHAH